MPLYQHINGKLAAIKEKPFKLEKDIQALVESNLKQLMDMEFVQTELTVQDVRFDTLAYDATTKSFVIIEYKKDSSTSIFDQGVSYLNQMLKNQAECVLAYTMPRKQTTARLILIGLSRVLFSSAASLARNRKWLPISRTFLLNSGRFADMPMIR